MIKVNKALQNPEIYLFPNNSRYPSFSAENPSFYFLICLFERRIFERENDVEYSSSFKGLTAILKRIRVVQLRLSELL